MVGKLGRIIIFTSNVEKMTVFYGEVLGLKPKADPKYPASEWIEFEAGGCRIALHKAGQRKGADGQNGKNPHKIAFQCDDIAAERKRLIAAGVAMGKHHNSDGLELCDGPDPDGNRFQLSNRK